MAIMGHDSPDEHAAAMKEFLNDWTPLTRGDRATAFQDGPGVLFVDGAEYAERAVAYVDASLEDDDAASFDVTIDGVRNADAIAVRRGDTILHRVEAATGTTVSLDRLGEPAAYTIDVKDADNGEWRTTATVGVERNPKKPIPEGRRYGAVVTQGGDIEESFGRKVVAKYRHDAVESWTHARYIVVGDAARKQGIPDDVLLNPTDHDYDKWFNAFYTDYRDIGWSVLETLLWPDWTPRNQPYVIICVS